MHPPGTPPAPQAPFASSCRPCPPAPRLGAAIPAPATRSPAHSPCPCQLVSSKRCRHRRGKRCPTGGVEGQPSSPFPGFRTARAIPASVAVLPLCCPAPELARKAGRFPASRDVPRTDPRCEPRDWAALWSTLSPTTKRVRSLLAQAPARCRSTHRVHRCCILIS